MNATRSSQQINQHAANRHQQSCFRVGVLVLLSLLFMLSNVMLVTSIPIRRALLDPEILIGAINEQLNPDSLFQKTVVEFSNGQAANLGSRQTLDISSLFSNLPSESKLRVQQLLIPEGFYQDLIFSGVNAFQLWVDNDEAVLEFTWNMAPLKARLAGEEGREAIRIAIDSLPECSQDEMNTIIGQMMTDPSAPIIYDRLCRFTEPYQDQQNQIMFSALQGLNEDISTTYIVAPIETGAIPSNTAAIIRESLNLALFYGEWGWVISLTLFFLLVFIGVRTFDSFSTLVGIPLIFSGMLSLAIAVVSRGWLLFRLSAMLQANVEPFFATIINGSLLTLSGKILQPMMGYGVAMLGMGGVLFIILMVKRIIKIR